LVQVWPFFAWSAFDIHMNALPYSMLNSMQASIALLNLINGVLLNHHHCFYAAIVCGGGARLPFRGGMSVGKGYGERAGNWELGLLHASYYPPYDARPTCHFLTPPLRQELAANNSGVPVYSYKGNKPYASPRDRLIHELQMFRQEYFAMLYGGVVSEGPSIEVALMGSD